MRWIVLLSWFLLAAGPALARDVAPAAPEALPAPPRPVQAAEPADPKGQALKFVQSYVQVGLFDWVVRWDQPLCIQVLGLRPDQAAAVKARMQAVAQTLSQRLYSTYQQCPITNVRVVFTADSQHTLDNMIAYHPWMLGDARSDTRDVKTVTRPIQAWYDTVCDWGLCPPDHVAMRPAIATVLVDTPHTAGATLNTIADYAVMLVLAEPRFPDRCQALPSVLDRFAGPCAGRPAPTGLTPSDLAFLKAMYTAGRRITEPEWSWAEGGGTVDQVAGRMGMLLSGSGALPSPGPAPMKR